MAIIQNFDGVFEYDLYLRIAFEKTSNIQHIQKSFITLEKLKIQLSINLTIF